MTQNGKVVRETVSTNGTVTAVMDFIYDESGTPFALKYSTNGGSSFTTYYYVVNLQGDVVKLVNAGGTAYATYTYNAWGEVLTATGSMASINPLRYRGYYYDSETGFYYLQSRYYDPVSHRFINADALASTGQGFTGTNMFAYCGNNSVSNIDPSGARFVGNGLIYWGNGLYAYTDGGTGCAYKRRNYIYDQDAEGIGDLPFGIFSNVSNSGCSAVATYNALISMGYDVEFEKICEYFKKSGLTNYGGIIGMNPESLVLCLRNLRFNAYMVVDPQLINNCSKRLTHVSYGMHIARRSFHLLGHILLHMKDVKTDIRAITQLEMVRKFSVTLIAMDYGVVALQLSEFLFLTEENDMRCNLKKLTILIVACIIVVFSLCSCQFERIVPNEGVWYCKELDTLMDFDKKENNQYKGEIGYQIDGEFKSNVIYFMTSPTYECVFWGECIFNDGSKMVIKEHYTRTEYTFIRQG